MSKIENLYIASDHAGFKLKSYLIESLKGYNICDLGTNSEDSVDYPDFARLLSNKIQTERDFGILICGSGVGISIAANRFDHIRAALCCEEEVARLAREHNNANVISLGARFVTVEKALSLCNVFLQTDFVGGRHQLRVDKLSYSQ